MRRPKQTRITMRSVRSRPKCSICGREWLSREEYAWRRKSGFAVWRCQHRRPSPNRNRELKEAAAVVAALAACALVLAVVGLRRIAADGAMASSGVLVPATAVAYQVR